MTLCNVCIRAYEDVKSPILIRLPYRPRRVAVDFQDAIYEGFAASRIRPMEFGGPDGTVAVTKTVIDIVKVAK